MPDPVRKQAGVQESSGQKLANASQPIRTGCQSDLVCPLGVCIYIRDANRIWYVHWVCVYIYRMRIGSGMSTGCVCVYIYIYANRIWYVYWVCVSTGCVLFVRLYNNPAPVIRSTQFHYCTVSNPGTGADDAFVLKRGV